MKERIITVYNAPELSPFDNHYKIAFALDEEGNLVWVSNHSSDDEIILPEENDEWFCECVQDIPDNPVSLNKGDYEYLDCNNKERTKIGEIILRYSK